jgi:hypothetical protein
MQGQTKRVEQVLLPRFEVVVPLPILHHRSGTVSLGLEWCLD